MLGKTKSVQQKIRFNAGGAYIFIFMQNLGAGSDVVVFFCLVLPKFN